MAKNYEAEESEPSSESEFELEEDNSASEYLPSPTNTNSIINSDSLFATESNPGFAQKPESIPKINAENEPLLLHVKTINNVNSKGGSRNLFQRVFSEEDEICVLKAMLEFVEETKLDPVSNIDEFKKNLKNLGVTRDQLYSKMKKLKGKFRSNAAKESVGHGLKFVSKHRREVYRLSQKIWGILDNLSGPDSKIQYTGRTGYTMVANGDGGSCIYTASEEWIMDQKMENVDRKKRRKLEKKLRKIEIEEIKLFAMRCEYRAEKARAIYDAIKANL